MASVDEIHGVIADLQAKPYSKVRRGYTYFEEEDILFAKITPSMQNGKSAIASGLIDGLGFGSTEFHVLRPSRRVIPEWIHLFVRQKRFRDEAVQHFRGAVGQQRVPEEFLVSYALPVPPLDEQRRIVARIEELFERMEEARRLRGTAEEEAERLMSATLENVFEETCSNFPQEPLGGHVSRITKGESPGWQGFSYVDDGPLFIRSENVLWGELDLTKQTRIPWEFHEKLARSQLAPEDVLINLVGASIGRACVLPDSLGSANINQAVAVVSPNRSVIESRYLMYYVISPNGQAIIHGGKVEAARANISLGDLKALPVSLPSIPEQRRIVDYLDGVQAQVAELRRLQAASAAELERLEGAVLARAFKGEL
jgi:type I restriction enzyme S subunit